jgi:hypothetical protein
MTNIAVRARFYVEAGLAILATGLGGLTIVWGEWIEALTGLEPDAGSGSAEWLVVAALFLVAATSAVLARREYRRARLAAA